MKLLSPRLKLAAASAVLLAAVQSLSAQISYVSGTYTQDFDTLLNTGAANAFTDNTTLLGWYAQAIDTLYSGSGAFTYTMTGTLNPQADDYAAGTGTGQSGDLYSFGAAGSTERALGTQASGTPDDIFVCMRVQNDTGLPIVRFTLSYDGEQWRRGGPNTPQRPETLQVFYRVGGTDFIGSTGWTEVPELGFTTPNALVTDTTATALDGNAVGNKVTGITKEVILSVPLAPGESIWITWVDADSTGTDHGMGIDNVSFTALTSSGSNVSIGAGLIFTPVSLGGNAFAAADTAVFDGTAATVSLSGNVAAAGIKFVTGGYVLSGTASDSLAVEGTISVDSNATISGVLAGTKGLTKIGVGTLVLSGANTFSGLVSINAGSLVIGGDANLGAADNDVALGGSLVTAASSLSLGSGRTLSGSGLVQTGTGGTLSFAGPVAAGTLTVSGSPTINFAGATNAVSSLVLAEATTINVTGGALQIGSGLALSQTTGVTTLAGAATFTTGDKLFPVPGGSLVFDGALTYGGGRLVKTGSGDLNLTFVNPNGTGGLRMGVIGSSPVTAGEGGLLTVDSSADFGTVQMHFNSGTVFLAAPVVSSVGISFGGRAAVDRTSVLSIPTFNGADLTLNGGSGFFYSSAAPSSDSDLALIVNNVTRLNGTFTRTTTGQVWVVPGGSGTLVIGGDASAMIDDFLIVDTLTFVIDGQLGGKTLTIGSGATLAGGGTFTGLVTTTTSADVPPVVTTTYSADSLATVNGRLAPTGLLTFNSGLQLAGSTVLDVGGLTRDTEYDSVVLSNLVTDGSIVYNLNLGGSLAFNFTAPALTGSYTLFERGANVTQSGEFSTVSVTGSHTGTLVRSGSVWTGTSGGTSFSFDESTGVLTVTGGASPTTPLEDWMILKFGTAVDTAETLYGPAEDFDGDGISNLLEYAFDTNPTVAGASPIVTGKSGNFLTLAYPRIADPALTYTVLGSGDLTTGFAAATGLTETSAGVSTYTDNVDVSAPGVRRFLRVEVSHTE